MKGDGGAIDLTDDPAALWLWMLAGPYISRLKNSMVYVTNHMRRKRDIMMKHVLHRKISFRKFTSLKQLLREWEILLIQQAILKLSENGGQQYKAFLLTKHDGNCFYDPIKKNNYRLFSPKPTTDSSKSSLASMKDDVKIFCCQSRQCDLQELWTRKSDMSTLTFVRIVQAVLCWEVSINGDIRIWSRDANYIAIGRFLHRWWWFISELKAAWTHMLSMPTTI